MGTRAEQVFAGQTVLVTGGGSGIGLALGHAMARQRAHVTLADVDGDDATAATFRLLASDPSLLVRGVELDVRYREAFGALVDGVVDRHGQLDCLVNNAGISMGGPTHELTGAHWDRMIDVNLTGVVNGVLAAYPHMVTARRGRLVNVASGAGLAPPPFVVPYAATKHAVVGLSLGLRPEAALHGVAVTVVCPGPVDTPILDRDPPAGLPQTRSAPVTARAYLQAVGQKPIDVEVFATKALRQLAKDPAIVVVPASAKALWYLQRISPTLVQHLTATLASKVQRELIQECVTDDR